MKSKKYSRLLFVLLGLAILLAIRIGFSPSSSKTSSPATASHGPIVEIWQVVVRNELFSLDELRRALEPVSIEALRDVPYTVAEQDEMVLVVDGESFAIPSLKREWAESLLAQLVDLPPDQQAAFLLKLDAFYAGIMVAWPTLEATWHWDDDMLDPRIARLASGLGSKLIRRDGTPWVYQSAALWRMWINSELVKLVDDAPAAKAYKPAEREALLLRIGKSGEFYREDPIP